MHQNTPFWDRNFKNFLEILPLMGVSIFCGGSERRRRLGGGYGVHTPSPRRLRRSEPPQKVLVTGLVCFVVRIQARIKGVDPRGHGRFYTYVLNNIDVVITNIYSQKYYI